MPWKVKNERPPGYERLLRECKLSINELPFLTPEKVVTMIGIWRAAGFSIHQIADALEAARTETTKGPSE